MRNWIVGIVSALLLFIPSTVGYLTAPCDPLTARPLLLNPHRLQQQRFFEKSTDMLEELAVISEELHDVHQQGEPRSMSAAFQRAGRVSDLIGRLDRITVPEAPPTYQMLEERLDQLRATYTLAAEDLLTYFGNADYAKLDSALNALILADDVHYDLQDAIIGLQYPLCREVWNE